MAFGWVWSILCLPVGVFLFLFGVLLLALSLPMHLFRLVVAHVLRPRWRPDLGPILNLQSSMLAVDYLETGTAPRNNYVLLLHLSHAPKNVYQFVCERVRLSWIEPASQPNSYFRKFLQYPVSWMGYIFWKNCGSFNIQKYVTSLQEATEAEVENLVESLLNSHFPRNQSPWSILVVENYVTHETQEPRSLLLVKVHHCLSDGFGMLHALVEGLAAQKLESIYEQKLRQLQLTFWGKLYFWVTLPLTLTLDLGRSVAMLLQGCACAVPDNRKRWRQVVARTPAIPVETVKRIKNAFGVSFASVLLSAFLSATRHCLEDAGHLKKGQNARVVIGNVLPLGDPLRRKELTNQASALAYPVPLLPTPENGLVTRLHVVNEALEATRYSVAMFTFLLMVTVAGAQILPLMSLLANQKWAGVGLTNFAGLPHNLDMRGIAPGMRLTHCECFVGALRGNAGIAAVLLSHERDIRIQLSAEEALFSREELGNLKDRLMEEVRILAEHAHKKKEE